MRLFPWGGGSQEWSTSEGSDYRIPIPVSTNDPGWRERLLKGCLKCYMISFVTAADRPNVIDNVQSSDSRMYRMYVNVALTVLCHFPSTTSKVHIGKLHVWTFLICVYKGQQLE